VDPIPRPQYRGPRAVRPGHRPLSGRTPSGNRLARPPRWPLLAAWGTEGTRYDCAGSGPTDREAAALPSTGPSAGRLNAERRCDFRATPIPAVRGRQAGETRVSTPGLIRCVHRRRCLLGSTRRHLGMPPLDHRLSVDSRETGDGLRHRRGPFRSAFSNPAMPARKQNQSFAGGVRPLSCRPPTRSTLRVPQGDVSRETCSHRRRLPRNQTST
jgi:hypothetical protein